MGAVVLLQIYVGANIYLQSIVSTLLGVSHITLYGGYNHIKLNLFYSITCIALRKTGYMAFYKITHVHLV